MLHAPRITGQPLTRATRFAWVSAWLLSLVFLCAVSQAKAHSSSDGPTADSPLQHLVVASQSTGWTLLSSAAHEDHGADGQDTPLAQFPTNQHPILSANGEAPLCPASAGQPAESEFTRPQSRAPPIV